MSWTNVHKWIVRYNDDKDPNITEFEEYTRMESMSMCTDFGNSVYHLAALGNSSVILNYILKSGPCYLMYKTNDREESPLHWACRGGNIQSVSILLRHGSAINQKNIVGDTPLHFAVEAENFHVVKLLVAAGADINARNNENASVLRYACIERSMEIIRYLVSHGAECYDVLSYFSVLGDSEIVTNLLDIESESIAKNHNPLRISHHHNYKMANSILFEKISDWIISKNPIAQTQQGRKRLTSLALIV